MTADFVDGSVLGGAHPVLDLGEGLFDWVEVGGVWRQIPEPCAGGFDQTAQCSRLVAAKIVHDDDVARLKLRNENLLNICAEAFAFDRAVEQAGCGEAVAAQGAKESQRPPVAVGREAAQPFAFWPPSVQWGHVGLNPGLVDKDQASGIELWPATSASVGVYVRCLSELARGRAAFFLKRSPSRRRNSQTALWETLIPRAASSSFRA